MTECEVCGQPADGALLCGGCVDQLAVRLREVPGLVDELDTTITRQDKLGARGAGGGQSEPPLPFNARASDARTDLRDILGSWCRDVAERSGDSVPYVQDVRNAAVVASSWLLGHLRATAHHPAAADLYEEVTDVIWQAVRAIDRPPDTVFAGRCECGALLHAYPGRSTVACRACALEHDPLDRRATMIASLIHHEGTAADVSRILALAGVQVPADTIRKWARRGKLQRLPGRLYRVGDVVDVAAA